VETDGAPVRGRSPGAGWRRVTHGVHVPAETSTQAELAGWQLLLPAHGCFTHLTAASVRGWWLPPLPAALPAFVSLGQRDPRPVRDGIRAIRLARPCAPELVGGVRVAPALEVLLACAQDLGLVDLVVLLDGAAHAGDVDLDELRHTVSGMRRRRGLRMLRRALELADARSESPWETLLRLLLVACGLAVAPQHEIEGAHGSVARVDLWLVGTTTAQEYDGEVHLPRASQKRDLRRLRRIDEAHWTRHGYTDDDVLRRAVGILRDADRAVGREHVPGRIRLWHDLLRQSLFTPAGTALLLTRLGIGEAA
jgi:hypothetical protein